MKADARPRKAKTPPWHLLNENWGKGQNADEKARYDAAAPPRPAEAPPGDGSAGDGSAPPAGTRAVRIPRREYDGRAVESVEEVKSNEIVISIGGPSTPPRGTPPRGGRTRTQSSTRGRTQDGEGGQNDSPQVGRVRRAPRDDRDSSGGPDGPPSDAGRAECRHQAFRAGASEVGTPTKSNRSRRGGSRDTGGSSEHGKAKAQDASRTQDSRRGPDQSAEPSSAPLACPGLRSAGSSGQTTVENRTASRTPASGGCTQGTEASRTQRSRGGRTQATEQSSAPLTCPGLRTAQSGTCVASGKTQSSMSGGCTQGTEKSSAPLTCPGLRPDGRSAASSPRGRRAGSRDASRAQTSRGGYTQGTEQSSAPLTCPGLIRPVGSFGTSEERGTRVTSRTQGSRRGGHTQETEQSSAPLTCPGLRAAGSFDSKERSPRPPNPPPKHDAPFEDPVPALAPAARAGEGPETIKVSSLTVDQLARLRDEPPASSGDGARPSTSLRRAALSLAVAAARADRPWDVPGSRGGGADDEGAAGGTERLPRLLRGTEVAVSGAFRGDVCRGLY